MGQVKLLIEIPSGCQSLQKLIPILYIVDELSYLLIVWLFSDKAKTGLIGKVHECHEFVIEAKLNQSKETSTENNCQGSFKHELQFALIAVLSYFPYEFLQAVTVTYLIVMIGQIKLH